MSPPEVWGPPVWTLFHTLAVKMNPDTCSTMIGSTFNMIKQICKVLPCPECSHDASNFLANIDIKKYKTKEEFRIMLYLFHNYVNKKKRKPLFDFSKMNLYARTNNNVVISNFIKNFHTKGNMKLLAETFQRGFVIKHFRNWYKTNYHVFNMTLIPTEVPAVPTEVPTVPTL